jgi:hypothetical protein
MDEHILTATAIRRDETIPLSRVEPLHSTCRHVRSPFEPNGNKLDWLWETPQESMRGRKVACCQPPDGGLRQFYVDQPFERNGSSVGRQALSENAGAPRNLAGGHSSWLVSTKWLADAAKELS